MKQLVFCLMCLFTVAVFASDKDLKDLKDLKVVSMSNRINRGNGHDKVCTVSVSDGTAVYTAFQEKYMFGMIPCPVIPVGSTVQGSISKNQKHLLLMIPNGDKVKQQNYVVTDIEAVQ